MNDTENLTPLGEDPDKTTSADGAEGPAKSEDRKPRARSRSRKPPKASATDAETLAEAPVEPAPPAAKAGGTSTSPDTDGQQDRAEENASEGGSRRRRGSRKSALKNDTQASPVADGPADGGSVPSEQEPARVHPSAPFSLDGALPAPPGEEHAAESPDGQKRKSRRSRRGGRGKGHGTNGATEEGQTAAVAEDAATDADARHAEDAATKQDDAEDQPGTDGKSENGTAGEGTEQKRRRRSRRGGRGKSHAQDAGDAATSEDGERARTDAPLPDETSQAEAPEVPAVDAPPKRPQKGRKSGQSCRRMLVGVVAGEQVEVALTEDGTILEYYLEMLHQQKIKGNIYKGVIQNIDTNLQAAFVNFGNGKNGFLQIDEIHPEYWIKHVELPKGRKFPLIQKALKNGQELLVQVVKEPTGNKGAFLTTWVSLAGRFLVLTPGQEQIGISRKVDDDEERDRLRELANDLDPGEGMGVIVRTVSAGTTKTTLRNDLQYLKRLWKDIRQKATEMPTPSLIHVEPSLTERAIRDYLTDDVDEIWVDNESEVERVKETVEALCPKRTGVIHLHQDPKKSMWERFNLQKQLEQIYSREVLLPSGGRLVFDQTEALMAIDINSGKISGKGDFEAMAYKTNLEAATMIARQLKLRDIGGQVVIDFIEMRDSKHVKEVEKVLRVAMKNDRARHDVGHISSFGLLELVRQRMGSSALAITMVPCPACGGTGQQRNMEFQALQVLREINRQARSDRKGPVAYQTTQELVVYLLNHKRDAIGELEKRYGKTIEISIGS
ncbi:MAG: Rne/Rng family ribonuclease [Desulfovibrio sp.]|jgi:ribonuclease E|nr:Rne/Rng family ribonuclease [Desulfovibrio sp.]